jgi:hypothetical protein
MDVTESHTSVTGALNDAIARAVAIAALTAIALIHILQLPDAFRSIGYLGGLFVAAIVACVLLASIMTRVDDARVWAAAGGLAGLILLCYLASRSVGLPGFTDDKGDWAQPLGLASMIAEGLVVGVASATLLMHRPAMRRSGAGVDVAASTGRGMRPGPAVG